MGARWNFCAAHQSWPAFSLAHQGVGQLVSYSPDGSLLFTMVSNEPVTAWDSATGKPLTRMNHPQAMNFALSRDGKRLITVGKYNVHMWSLPAGQSLGGSDLRNQIAAARFRPEGQAVVFQVAGSTVVVSDAVTGAETARYDTGSKFDELAISDDGTYLATRDSAYQVRIWEGRTGRLVATADTPGAISGLVFSTTGKWLGGKSYFDTAVVWEAATGRQKVLIPLKGESNLKLGFSPNEEAVVVATDHALHVFDTGSGGERVRTGGKADFWGFSPNGAYIAAAASGSVRLLDAANGGELARAEYNKPNSLAFSPNSQRFAVTGWSKVLACLRLAQSGISRSNTWLARAS